MSRRFVKIIFALFLLLGLTACAETDVNVPALMQPEEIAFDTAVAERGSIISATWQHGVVRYVSEPIYFETASGNFGSFYVSPGDHVVQGQLLAQLDTEEIERQIANEEERLASLRTERARSHEMRQLELDIRQLENNRFFTDAVNRYDEDAINTAVSRNDDIARGRMEARQDYEMRTLNIRRTEATLRSLRERYEQSMLYASFDGMVTFVANINRGQSVDITQPLLHMTTGEELIVEIVGLTDEDFPRPMPGFIPPTPWIPTFVQNATEIRGYINGRVVELEYIDITTAQRAFRPVMLSLVCDGSLEVGEYVSVYFYRHRIEDALRIPANAIFIAAAESRVFVYKVVNGALVETDIRISVRTDTEVAVIEGLSEGDVIFVRP